MTIDEARDAYEAAFSNYMGLHDAWVTLTHADDPQARERLAAKADIAHQELRAALDAYRDAVAARARDEGAREALKAARESIFDHGMTVVRELNQAPADEPEAIKDARRRIVDSADWAFRFVQQLEHARKVAP
jgi:heme oxygenase